MENSLFIKNNIEKISRGEYSDFLDPIERKKVINALNKTHITFFQFIPFKGAEKTIIYSDTKPLVTVLKIKCKHKLKHNEILGSLFSHNISITKYGDIIISDSCYIIVLDCIKKYLLTHFNMVGKHKVELEEVSIELISDYEIEYEELNILVSSLRLDNVISSIINTSRKDTEGMFQDKYILVNYEVNTKKTYILKENDIISIRKFGKYVFKEILKKTAKGKYILKIYKYK